MASSNEILGISEVRSHCFTPYAPFISEYQYVKDHIIPRFACKYLDCSSLSPINSSMKDFRDSLDYVSAEIERIDTVVTQYMNTSWTFLCQLRQRIVHAKETGVKNAFPSFHDSLTNLAQEIVDLDNFCRTHRVAFLKILNYYEPRMSTGVQESLHTKCRRSSFGSVQLNLFLIPMSECYSVLRDLCDVGSHSAELESNKIDEVVQPLNTESFATTYQSAGEASHTPADTVRASENTEKTAECWVPPSSFKRKTNKYWVRNRDVLRLCFKIMQHLPILVFGKGEGLPGERTPL
jgi:SPX domain protein involved in polyphosphate accumulation